MYFLASADGLSRLFVSPENPLPVETPFQPNGLATHVSRNAATATELEPPEGAKRLMIQALTQNVRYTLDGTTPTASVGFQLKAGDPPRIIPLSSETTVKVIQEIATASIQYQWSL